MSRSQQDSVTSWVTLWIVDSLLLSTWFITLSTRFLHRRITPIHDCLVIYEVKRTKVPWLPTMVKYNTFPLLSVHELDFSLHLCVLQSPYIRKHFGSVMYLTLHISFIMPLHCSFCYLSHILHCRYCVFICVRDIHILHVCSIGTLVILL